MTIIREDVVLYFMRWEKFSPNAYNVLNASRK